ncbi:NfeD family protein [Conexibacter arvalis]|uniref:Membrane protein implicated in regulation of membrane protease activity n=1 Tax=Conexibacter arvalis TaxID=912552 RepID=A0A840IJW3_9ACTN|nr:NfeD family protein [Conexibacter arvalis]MBB4664625.1 membrane protein implicated in regulation of membrane protease activity [Conexibacter arvalis]
MDAWVIWIIVACLFGVGEIASTSFFLGPFALGAVVAAIVAALGGGAVAAAAVFILVSVLLLLFVRPIARAHLRTPAQIRTGAAALVGRRAMVIERISNDEAVGCVRIDGEVWTARAYDDDDVIEAGTPVQVIEIRGATALVSE